jgi:guanylate kinase
MAGKLFIISASSGAGKTTLVNAVLQRIQSTYDVNRVLTYTTRTPRQGEVGGIDYQFVTVQEFEALIVQGFFLEWSNAYGAYYGSPSFIIDELPYGKSYIAILDRAGAERAVKVHPDSVLIWIYADVMSLHDRLVQRKTETNEQIEYRIQLAKKEIEEEIFKKFFTFHLHNDDFNRAIQELEALIVDLL